MWREFVDFLRASGELAAELFYLAFVSALIAGAIVGIWWL